MTKEDIIRMAREQGLPETETEGVFIVNTDDLGRLIAAEREACAKVCENFNINHQDCNYYDRTIAAAIRSRGDV